MLIALVLLAAAQPAPPARGARVEELPNGQFRVIVAKRGISAEPMIRAELETRAAAARRCEGQGGAVPVDRGSINVMQNERWEMTSTFTCRTPPAAAAPPPSGA